MSYTCIRLDVTNQKCIEWTSQSATMVDALSITADQAAEISVAMCSVILIAWVIGEIGSMMKNLLRR